MLKAQYALNYDYTIITTRYYYKCSEFEPLVKNISIKLWKYFYI